MRTYLEFQRGETKPQKTLWTQALHHGCAAGIYFICLIQTSQPNQKEIVSVPAEEKNITMSSIIGNKAPEKIIRCQFWYREYFHFHLSDDVSILFY